MSDSVRTACLLWTFLNLFGLDVVDDDVVAQRLRASNGSSSSASHSDPDAGGTCFSAAIAGTSVARLGRQKVDLVLATLRINERAWHACVTGDSWSRSLKMAPGRSSRKMAPCGSSSRSCREINRKRLGERRELLVIITQVIHALDCGEAGDVLDLLALIGILFVAEITLGVFGGLLTFGVSCIPGDSEAGNTLSCALLFYEFLPGPS